MLFTLFLLLVVIVEEPLCRLLLNMFGRLDSCKMQYHWVNQLHSERVPTRDSLYTCNTCSYKLTSEMTIRVNGSISCRIWVVLKIRKNIKIFINCRIIGWIGQGLCWYILCSCPVGSVILSVSLCLFHVEFGHFVVLCQRLLTLINKIVPKTSHRKWMSHYLEFYYLIQVRWRYKFFISAYQKEDCCAILKDLQVQPNIIKAPFYMQARVRQKLHHIN